VIVEGKTKSRRNRKRRIEDVKIETVNSTGWEALLHRLKTTDADILCAQEHHTLEFLVAERSALVKSLGWKSTWAAALPTAEANSTDARTTSGGVAIFVRDYLGMAEVDKDLEATLVPGRAISAKVSAPGMGSIIVYSLYMVTGVGINTENCNILEALVRHIDHHGLGWVAGADWNMEPAELMKSDIGSLLRARPLVPDSSTCISPSCTRTIDYFMVSESLVAGMQQPITDEDVATRPHRPVAGKIKAGLKAATKAIFRPAKRLPIDPHYRSRPKTARLWLCQVLGGVGDPCFC